MKRLSKYTVGWALIVGAGVALEFIALVDEGEDGTLTGHIRRILDLHPLSWVLGAALAVISFKHLFIDGRRK